MPTDEAIGVPKPTAKPRCKATTKAGTRCRQAASVGELCPTHAGTVDLAAAGAVGGRRSAEVRRQGGRARRTFREALVARLEGDPDRLADQLLSSKNAAGIVAALRYLGAAAPEPYQAPELDPAGVDPEGAPIQLEGRTVVGLADVVKLAIETGQAHLLGIPGLGTDAARVALSARGGRVDDDEADDVDGDPPAKDD